MATETLLYLIISVSILPMPSWCGPIHLWPLTKDTLLWSTIDADKSVSTFVNGGTCPLLVSDSLYGDGDGDGEDDGSFYYDGSTASVADIGVMSDKNDAYQDTYGFTLWLKPDSATSTGELFEYKSALDENNRVTSVRAELVNGMVKFTVANNNGDMGSVTSSVGVDDTKFIIVLLWANEEGSKMRLHVAVDGHEDYTDTSVNKEDMHLKLGGKWRLGEFVSSSGARYAGKINCISFKYAELSVLPAELATYKEECSKDMYKNPGSTCSFATTSTTTPTTTSTTTTTLTTTTPTTTLTTTVTTTTPTTSLTTTTPTTTLITTTPTTTPTTSLTTTTPSTTLTTTTPTTTPTTTLTTTTPTTTPTTTLTTTTPTTTPTTTLTTTTPTTTLTTTTPTTTPATSLTTSTPTTTPTTSLTTTTPTTTPTTTLTTTTPTTTPATSLTTTTPTTTPTISLTTTTPTTTPTTSLTTTSPTTTPTTSPTTTPTTSLTTTTPTITTATPTTPSTSTATTTPSTSATTTATTLTTTTTPTTTAPTYLPVNLLPLDNVTRGYDVITGSSPLTSQETLACLRTEKCPADTTLSLKNDVLFFDGSLGSAVEIEVNRSALDDDFTVVVYVRPQQPPEGQVWSYAAPGASDGLSRIEVSLHSNGSLTTTLWGSEGQASCATIEAAGVFDASSDFTRVIVGRKTSAITLQVGDDVWVDSANSCPRSPVSSGQGSLKVGGRGEGQSAGYRGHVVCMAVFSQYVSTVGDEQLFSLCGGYYPASSLGAKACNRTAEIRTERFKLFARNKAPDMTSLPPMTSFQTSSVVKCAGRCLRSQHCKSFTFSSGDVTSSCSLFDVVTLTGLGDSKGNYYEITSD